MQNTNVDLLKYKIEKYKHKYNQLQNQLQNQSGGGQHNSELQHKEIIEKILGKYTDDAARAAAAAAAAAAAEAAA